jgi:methyl-accepting chemotaxis protein
MSRESRLDEPYLDLRAQEYADKSFMGGTPLSTRTALFFFIGVLSMAALAVIYVYVDDRLARSLNTWKDAQQISSSISELNSAIEDVRVQDGRARENRDAAIFQAHRRAIDRVAVALGTLQGIEQTTPIHDATITIRDAFTEYGGEFSAAVENRAVLGATETSGIRAQRQDAARDVRDGLTKNGLKALLADFNTLDGEADAEPSPNSTEDRTRIAARYEKLNKLISKSAVNGSVKTDLQRLLRTHAAVLVAMNDTRARLESAPQAFEEILDYIGPALRQVAEFSGQFGRSAPDAFEREHLLARQITAFASAGAILFLILSGVIIMRSITSPLRRLVDATEQLARGDRFMTVPLRGNGDAIGRMARALDNWLDHLAEVDHMRAELDDARMRLSVDAAMRKAELETETANDSEPAPETEEEILSEVSDDKAVQPDGGDRIEPSLGAGVDTMLPPEPTPEEVMEQLVASNTALPPEVRDTPSSQPTSAAPSSGLGGLSDLVGEAKHADRSSSSIGTASKHLTQISEYVTAATVDVERTETLIQTLADTARQLVDLEICVSTIRDEANLIVFRSSNRSDGDRSDGSKVDDNLVYLSSDRDGAQGSGGPDAPRFNTIRDSVNRAERLVVSVRKSLDTVTTVAHEIASTASNEALEATNKLLSQSEYLQHMLDDLVSRISPVKQDMSDPSRPPSAHSPSRPIGDGDA